MRFKIDESMPPGAAALLVDAGHDAMTVAEQGLRGIADAQLAEVVRREGRAIMTLDLGFCDIRRYPPADYSGLIVLRPSSQDRATVLAIVSRLIGLLDTETLPGRLWVVDDSSLRVRE